MGALGAGLRIAGGLATGGAAGGVMQGIAEFGAVRDALVKNIPTLDDEVTVEVLGQPGHSKQQLYFLALAAANGMVRRMGDLSGGARFLTPGYGMILIEYDAADHWVRCTIRYRWSMAQAAVSAPGGAVAATVGAVFPPLGSVLGAASLSVGASFAEPIFDKLAVYRGPQCDVVGGDFDFVASTPALTAGIPPRSSSDKAPQLPFKGQPILTSCPTTPEPKPRPLTQVPAPSLPVESAGNPIPSPNPKPPGDNRSRGAVVVPPSAPGGAVPPVGVPPSGIPSSGNILDGVFRFVSSGAKCCDKSLALVPLVFAALSAPATNAHMVFPPPKGGPTGV